MMARAVIFDIGNVLIEWRPERFFDRHIGLERRRKLFAEADLHGANDKVDAGAPLADTIADLAARTPHLADEIRMWHDHWIDIAGPEITHSVRLLRALRRRGIPVMALSNFGIETFRMAQARYPFLDEFDRRFISGHLGVIKPAEDIYRIVERDCGHAPGDLLFTDDRPDNIAAAAARGWQVHLFDGAAGLSQALVDHGLLTGEEAQ
jgi:2-haloacid dehalogenase